jgi:SAM-dependent methyltransferase
MLEFGCSHGAFLQAMAEKGWTVMGVEPSLAAASIARGHDLNVQARSLEEAECEPGTLDLVVGWMALEHLHDPVAALKKLHVWARPAAWLVVSVPNAASMDFVLFRENGFAVQAPTHLYHFTPATIERVLESCGWRVERIIHQRNEVNLMKSIGHLLSSKRAPEPLATWFGSYERKGLFTRVAMVPMAQILGLLGHSGRMVVWATKD